MRKIFSWVLLSVCVLAFTAMAEPCPITGSKTLIYKDFGDDVYFSKKGGVQSHHIIFDVSEDFESVEKACLTIQLSDDSGSILDMFENASIFLDGERVVHRDEVDRWLDGDLIEDYPFYNDQVLPYFDDMILDIEIIWERPLFFIGQGDFYYMKSILAVTGTPVPIPSSVWLLVSGLMGLAGIRRGFKKPNHKHH